MGTRKLRLAHPDLRPRTNEPLANPTRERTERMLVIFDMLISLFERAYPEFQHYLRRVAEEERSAFLPVS